MVSHEIVIDYLIAEWNEMVINDFVDKTEDCIKVLISYPYIGRESEKRKGVRKVLISKHNLPIYKVSKGNINILDIFMPVKTQSKASTKQKWITYF